MIRQLRDLNPVPDVGRGPHRPDRSRATSDLERILATARPPRRSRAPFAPRVLIAAAVALAVGVAGAIGIPLLPGSNPSSAYSATPPVVDGALAPGVADLRDVTTLARVAATSARAATTGSTYETWSLFTAVGGRERVRSAVVPQEVRLTLNADHSGRLVSTTGAPIASSGSDPSALDLPAAGTVTRDEAFGAGRAVLVYPSPLSSDPRTLWTQLTSGHPVDELGSGELFVALADLYREQTPSASVRAALLELVATRSDVRDLGILTDRAGRSGRALGVSSSQPGGLPARFVVVIDESTGRLLSYEQTLTSDPGKLDVKIPAVIDYTLFR